MNIRNVLTLGKSSAFSISSTLLDEVTVDRWWSAIALLITDILLSSIKVFLLLLSGPTDPTLEKPMAAPRLLPASPMYESSLMMLATLIFLSIRDIRRD